MTGNLLRVGPKVFVVDLIEIVAPAAVAIWAFQESDYAFPTTAHPFSRQLAGYHPVSSSGF
jgi:hypothetical protein